MKKLMKSIKILLATVFVSLSAASQDGGEPIPASINFDWQVTQRMPKDDDDDNNGQAYEMVTYYFTTNGDYTAIMSEGSTFSLMIYSKTGQTWTIYKNKNALIVMDMPKTVAEGGLVGKAVAEGIAKQPIEKDSTDDGETLDVVKTGKTKNILGYTADEYLMKPKQMKKTKEKNAAAISFWYIKVPFDPVRIYTMGVGRPADLSKIQNNPKYKNNIMAIPILNMNYLWAETEVGGKKGQETLEIKHVNNTVLLTGYAIIVTHNLKEALKAEMDMNK
jgi:hypothetical protein